MKSLVAQAQRDKKAAQDHTAIITTARGGAEKADAAPAWTVQALDEPEALLRQQFAEVAAQRNAIAAESSKAKVKNKGTVLKSGTKSSTATKTKQSGKEGEKIAAVSAWESLRQEEEVKLQIFAERAAAAAAAASAASASSESDGSAKESSNSGSRREHPSATSPKPAEGSHRNKKKLAASCNAAETRPNESTTTAVAAAAWASLAKEEEHRTKQFRKRVSKLAPPDANPPL
jgi:hypothetical protein